MVERDLSYLQAFSPKALRSAKRILEKGFTADDINAVLGQPKMPPDKAALMRKMGWELKKPCRGCKDKEKEEK